MLDAVKGRYGISADYQDGPFLIVLNRHPADARGADSRASAIGFKGYSNSQVQSLLGELRKEIAAARQAQPQGVFYQLLEGIRLAWSQTNNPLANRLAISVAGGG